MTLTNKQVRELFTLSAEWFDTYRDAVERIINEQEPCKCGGSCSGNCHHDEPADEEPKVFLTNLPMAGIVDAQEMPKTAPQSEEKPKADKLPDEPKEEAKTADFIIAPGVPGSGGAGGHTSLPVEPEKPKKRKYGNKEYPNFRKPSELTNDQLGKVYALYTAGWSVPKIADEMRLEPRSAHFAIDRAMAYMKNHKEEPEVEEDAEAERETQDL